MNELEMWEKVQEELQIFSLKSPSITAEVRWTVKKWFVVEIYIIDGSSTAAASPQLRWKFTGLLSNILRHIEVLNDSS